MHTNYDSDYKGHHKVLVQDVDSGNERTSALDPTQENSYYDVVYLKPNADENFWPEGLGSINEDGTENVITLEAPTLVYRNVSFLEEVSARMVLQEFLSSSGNVEYVFNFLCYHIY